MTGLETRGHLLTEQNNPNSANLDQLTSLELVDLFNREDAQTLTAIANAREDLAYAIDATTAALKQGGRLIYIGAGTSGRLGVLDASECPPTFCTPPELVQGIIAGGHRLCCVAPRPSKIALRMGPWRSPRPASSPPMSSSASQREEPPPTSTAHWMKRAAGGGDHLHHLCPG